MKFSEIPQFTREGSYRVNVNWKYLHEWLESQKEELNLQMEPLFQRGHVWTREQQIAYVEFILRGGKSSRDIYFNCPGWHWRVKEGEYNDFVCVDGVQRVTAVEAFMGNQIPAFGVYFKDYEDRVPMDADFVVHVNDLKTEAEVLQWYLDLNSGGTPHTNDEIQRVRDMLDIVKCTGKYSPTVVEPGAIIYWARKYDMNVYKCQVVNVEKEKGMIDRFRVKVISVGGEAPYLNEIALSGHTIDRVVFADEQVAINKLNQFGGDIHEDQA